MSKTLTQQRSTTWANLHLIKSLNSKVSSCGCQYPNPIPHTDLLSWFSYATSASQATKAPANNASHPSSLPTTHLSQDIEDVHSRASPQIPRTKHSTDEPSAIRITKRLHVVHANLGQVCGEGLGFVLGRAWC
jgi:hypothetical protein